MYGFSYIFYNNTESWICENDWWKDYGKFPSYLLKEKKNNSQT